MMYETLRQIWQEDMEVSGEDQNFSEWLKKYRTWVAERNCQFHSQELINAINEAIITTSNKGGSDGLGKTTSQDKTSSFGNLSWRS